MQANAIDEMKKQALNHYRAGNYKDAQTILIDIVQQDPSNVEAWYGLSLCTNEVSHKRDLLEKVLALKPDHEKARELINRLPNLPKEQNREKKIEQDHVDQNEDGYSKALEKKITIISRIAWFNFFLAFIFLIVLIFLWSWERKLENSLRQAETRIATLESDVKTLESGLQMVNRKITTIQTSISSLSSDINSIGSFVNGLSTNLSRVAALAENANMYAHSHNTYSDVRLKTNVRPLQNPISQLMQLQGIYYRWTTNARQQYGLSSDDQVGLIAQDLEQVFPEVVSQDENGYLTVDYARLVPVLIEAIKAQQVEIGLLKQHVWVLEKK